ncbi:DUF4328 domain-containing protein [Pseudonocardiaceae bacterium YIM PH 21723]|nr:DUF4328 domain-containing protein [Pseudonocardiaceae bacterium YIM PH 21723]
MSALLSKPLLPYLDLRKPPPNLIAWWAIAGVLAHAALRVAVAFGQFEFATAESDIQGIEVQHAADHRQFRVEVLDAALVLFAGLAVIYWLVQVRQFCEARSGRAAHRLARMWGILGWLPVVNLVVPRRYLLDIWRATAPASASAFLVHVWWVLWLARIGSLMVEWVRFGGPPEQAAIQDRHWYLLWTVQHCFVTCLGAVVFAAVVLRIRSWQRAAYLG